MFANQATITHHDGGSIVHSSMKAWAIHELIAFNQMQMLEATQSDDVRVTYESI